MNLSAFKLQCFLQIACIYHNRLRFRINKMDQKRMFISFVTILTIAVLSTQVSFVSATDWANGPIRDIDFYGIRNNRMIIAYRGLGDVYIKGMNSKRYRDTNWMDQNNKYGDNKCWYAEFPLVSFPAKLQVVGNTLAHVGTPKPAVEAWSYFELDSNGIVTFRKVNA